MYFRPNNDYPWNWNDLRWRVFSRDDYICQRCNEYSKGDLHCHHIKPIRCGGTHHPNNLATVCSRCHDYIHSGRYRGPLLKLRKVYR